MKKITIILAAAASVMLAGCAKEQFVGPSASKTTLSVSIDNDDTKTTIGDLDAGKRPIYWANGDQICVNGVASDELAGLEEGQSKAEFTFQSEVTAPYNVLYPASYYKNASTITLPAVASSLPVPMAANSLSIKAVTGVLKITVNAKAAADSINIIQVEVSSATAQLSGDFTINYAEGTLTGCDSSEAAKKVVLKKNRGLGATTPYEVFIPVPAGTYDFSVKLLDCNGKYMIKSTTGAKTIKAGQISALAAFEYDPAGTEAASIEITSAKEFVAFAKKSNAGEFNDKPWPVVKLMNDITFDATTSKALRDEDGVGVPADSAVFRYEDQYFNGIFDGQGYKIKGYISYETVKNVAETADSIVVWAPIFNYTGSDSFIRNVVIDESCDLQLPKGGFGSIAYRVKGVVENITCNANISVNFVAGTSYIGGIVGRIYGGTVRNCTMNGNIVTPVASGSTSKVWNFGGIAGTLEAGGLIENCTNNGYLQWGTASAGDGPGVTSEFYLGGIVGNVIEGSVKSCTVSKASKTTDVRGKPGTIGHIGGVVGKLNEDCTVSDCTNNQVYYIRAKGQSGAGTILYLGGIVGYNNGTVANCNNSNQITGNDTHETLALGGVVGKNDGEIISSGNTGKIIGPSQYTGTTMAYIGGIVGWTTKSLSSLTNSGSVVTSTTNTTWGSLLNVIRAHGGVVGYAEDAITLDSLTNNGAVSYSMTTKTNGSGAMVGGIAGYINGPVKITSCTNNGYVFGDDFDNTTTPYISAVNTGGIAAVVSGIDGNNALIEACTNNQELGCRRGNLGGICGWAKRVTIKDCNNYGGTSKAKLKDTVTDNISHFLGGIAAVADTSAVITSCRASDITLRYKPATAACTTGGIAGALLDGTSRIVECTAKNIIIEPLSNDKESECLYGGIAGTSVENSWIHSCKFAVSFGIKGNTPEALSIFEICSDSNFDNDGNNEVIEEE